MPGLEETPPREVFLFLFHNNLMNQDVVHLRNSPIASPALQQKSKIINSHSADWGVGEGVKWH